MKEYRDYGVSCPTSSVMDTGTCAIRLIKDICRKTLPLALRQSRWIVKFKQHVYWHNLIYDSEYYACHDDDPAIRSVASISESILESFAPKSVIDVGCGTGALLSALRNRGCEVLGLEYSDAALRLCRGQRIPVLHFNLDRDTFTDRRTFDLVISMEVAEHLPARTADRYVKLLTSLSSVIVFTAAPPGQGGRVGTDHINEQPPAYWIAKFDQHGFGHDQALSQTWREAWRAKGDVALCYHQNLMIFKKDRQ